MSGQAWTTAQRKAQSIRTKAWYAKKKYNKNQAKIKFPDVPITYTGVVNKPLKPAFNYLPQAAAADAVMTPAVDENYIREYNYRRGLVTAMECILRELR